MLSRFFPIEQFWADTMVNVFFNVRLPRIIMPVWWLLPVRSRLRLPGHLPEPMASPDILGATKGSASAPPWPSSPGSAHS